MSNKFAAIDGLRAIAILLVLAAHMIPLGGTGNDVAGSMGMSLFFCLSGFLITTTLLHNPDLTEFIVRRCARIVPLAYLYISLVFILFLALLVYLKVRQIERRQAASAEGA